MKSVLSEKVAENNLVAIEGLNFDAPKTKEFKQVLANLSIDSKVLVVLEKVTTLPLYQHVTYQTFL